MHNIMHYISIYWWPGAGLGEPKGCCTIPSTLGMVGNSLLLSSWILVFSPYKNMRMKSAAVTVEPETGKNNGSERNLSEQGVRTY